MKMASIIHEKQNLSHLRWDVARKSSGTVGSFLKAYSDLGGAKTYYKLSNYDAYKGVVGHECVNEIIPKDRAPAFRPLKRADRAGLFDELNPILPQKWQNKIWQMLWRRWTYYENFRGARRSGG